MPMASSLMARNQSFAEGGSVKKDPSYLNSRMAQLDAYLADPSLKLIRTKSGKFQFVSAKPPAIKTSSRATTKAATPPPIAKQKKIKSSVNNAGRNALPLSEFNAKGKRVKAAPLASPTKVNAPRTKSDKELKIGLYEPKFQKKSSAYIASSLLPLGGPMGKVGSKIGGKIVGKIDSVIQRAANRPLTQSRLSATLARTRPGEVARMPRDAIAGANRVVKNSEYKAKPISAKNVGKVKGELNKRLLSPEEAVDKALGYRRGGKARHNRRK